MAMMFREANRFGVKFAGERDVCFYCLKELWEQHKDKPADEFNSVIGRRKLEGKLTGEKVWAQGDTLVCKRHIGVIYQELGALCDDLDKQMESASE